MHHEAGIDDVQRGTEHDARPAEGPQDEGDDHEEGHQPKEVGVRSGPVRLSMLLSGVRAPQRRAPQDCNGCPNEKPIIAMKAKNTRYIIPKCQNFDKSKKNG